MFSVSLPVHLDVRQPVTRGNVDFIELFTIYTKPVLKRYFSLNYYNQKFERNEKLDVFIIKDTEQPVELGHSRKTLAF